MNKNTLDVIEYLVEYTEFLNDTAHEIAEKVLFDGCTDDLDALERDVYSKEIEPLLTPACLGIGGKGCVKKSTVETEFVLECYQSGIYLCQECRELSEIKKAS